MDRDRADADDASADASKYAYRTIRRDILDGTLAAGTVLSQVTLARSMRISRTPLREALRQLASDGLVAGDFNRRLHVTRLDLADFEQIYALRMSIEPMAIMATVPRLREAEKDELASHLAGMDVALTQLDARAFRSNHRSFHLGLAAHAGARVEKLLAELWDHSERYRLRYMHPDADDINAASAERVEVSRHEHRELLAAASQGDAESCAQLLVAHLNRTLESVLTEMAAEAPPRLSRLLGTPSTALGLER